MKKYWFIAYSYSLKGSFGYGNLGFVSDSENPLSNEVLKEHIIKNNFDLEKAGLVILNISQFSTEKEYSDFFKN